MADTQSLTATSSSGQQGTTQNPQAAGASNGGGAEASDFQPTTTSSALTSTGGVPLQTTAVTTVPLVAPTNSGTLSTPVKAPVAPHHVNVALLAFPVVFVVCAVLVFMSTSRAAKTTTY